MIPHVTLEIVDVLRALGVSFVAGTGPQFCCGKPFRTRDRQDAGVKVSQASLDRFMSWGATTATHVCQSCQIIYSNHVAERESAAPGLVNVHLTEFIENRIRELGDDVPWKREPGLRMLTANCHAMSPVHKASHASVERIMRLIHRRGRGDDLDVVARCPVYDGLPGRSEHPRRAGRPEERAEVTRDLEDQARAAGGADTIVMHAHWCQREWQKFSSDRLGVKHFVSVLAEALDCSHPNRYDQFWKLGDPEAVVEQSRPYWESWGLSPAQARDIAYKKLPPALLGLPEHRLRVWR